MKLHIVGCTGSMSGPRSAASCYLVQARGIDPETGNERTWNVALDMGPGSFGQLWRIISPSELDALVFSHCHADHMGDVISLHVYRRWGPGRDLPPMLVAGPGCVRDRIRQIDGAEPGENYDTEFSFHTMEDGVSFRVGSMTLTPAPAWHSVPCFGVRIEGPSEDDGRQVSLFYTGDTDECDSIVDGARGVDLLLSEAGFMATDEAQGIHMDGARAGNVAAHAGVSRMVLTHIQPWNDHEAVRSAAEETWGQRPDVAQAGQVYLL